MAKQIIDIDNKVMQEMFEYAAWAKYHFGTEIAGWGHYRQDKGIYKLAPLCKQEVNGAEVDTFPDEIINNVKYNMSDMVVQWHSHVDMGVTPSTTDKKQIKEALALYTYLISIIVNCKGQYSAELNIATANGMVLDEPMHFDVELMPYFNNKRLEKDVLDKCYKPVPKASVPVVYSGYNWNNWGTTFEEANFVEDYIQSVDDAADSNNKDYIAGMPNQQFFKALEKCPRLHRITVGKAILLFTKEKNIELEYEENGTLYVYNAATLAYAYLYNTGETFINGVKRTMWRDFLRSINMEREPYIITKEEWMAVYAPENNKVSQVVDKKAS